MISVPNEFTRERIETRQRSDIEQALSDHFHRSMRLAITIDPDLELNLQPPDRPEEADIEPMELIRRPDAPSPFTPMDPAHAQSPAGPSPGNGLPEDRLNPKYTFDNFVIGSSNRFAHAAAVAVAEAPGKAYNPLMIYSDSGYIRM